jgi:hypothetical protein
MTMFPVVSLKRVKLIKSSGSTGFFGVISLIMRAASLNRSLSSLGTRIDNVTASTLGLVSTAIVLFGVSFDGFLVSGFQTGNGYYRPIGSDFVASGFVRFGKGKDGELIGFECVRLVLLAVG